MYGIISDTHCHNWSMFSSINSNGVNSRLEIILEEIRSAGNTLLALGATHLFHAGDLFHVRGSVAPSVLNPTLAVFEILVKSGLNVVLTCGNHDAEFRETTSLGSAIEAFRAIGCKVINEQPEVIYVSENEAVVVVPWCPTKDIFLQTIKKIEVPNVPFDIVTHVALDGVFGGISASAIVDVNEVKEIFKGTKFKRIFAGHLHRHKQINDFAWSVGAIAHHNWGDVGANAGFLVVDSADVIHYPSTAPKFVELSQVHKPTEVVNNYVRVTIEATSEREVKEIRQCLLDEGAMGVTIISKTPEIVRSDRIDVKSEGGLPCVEDLVGKFVDNMNEQYERKINPEGVKEIKQMTLEILKEAENDL